MVVPPHRCRVQVRGDGRRTFPRTRTAPKFQWCPNCHLSVIDVERRYEGPWLTTVCRFCHWQRTNRRRWAKERLRILETRPGDEIPRWRDIAVNPHWDDYADVNKKRRLRLHAERIVDRGEDFNFEPRTLGKAHRNTMEGQLALEYGYIGKNGKPGPQVERRRLDEIALCRELLACVVCQKQTKLDGLWICTKCKDTWTEESKPYGDAYASFAIKQRWGRTVRIYPIDRTLDFYHSALRIRAEKSLEPFDKAADLYPWRHRLVLFRYYVHSEEAMPGPVETEITITASAKGTPSQVASQAWVQQLLGGPISAGEIEITDEMANVLQLRRPS